MRKCIIILIIWVFLAALCSAQSVRYGDVNGDSTVNIVDALVVAQYYVGLITTLPVQQAADVSNDGQINIVDALMIAQYSVGLIPYFPADVEPRTVTPVVTRTSTMLNTGPTVIGPTLSPPGPRPSPARTVPLNTSFTMAYGETVLLSSGSFNYLVTFKEVTDSRCPTDAVCVVEGEAVGTFDLWTTSYLGEIQIKAPPATSRSAGRMDPLTSYYYGLSCLSIDPYPTLEYIAPRSEHTATLTGTIAIP